MPRKPFPLSLPEARTAWLRAQRLDTREPFGEGAAATQRAVAHLGYVQIDTIAVIERSHHHILFTRIPAYKRADLDRAQSTDKSLFEYWTHALAYVPTEDYRFFLPLMERFRQAPDAFSTVNEADYAALLRRVRKDGALTIRDIDDDVLVDKTHPWGSRKPSKRALRHGFFVGDLTISKRTGMVKTYELTQRHFGWKRRPKPATEAQRAAYMLERATRAQGIVSLDSICYGELGLKKEVARHIDIAIRRKRLVPLELAGFETIEHWAPPEVLESLGAAPAPPLVHILSPFDPLVIQRKRLKMFFDHEHRFEAYVPADKRVLGYFALPVLVGDAIVAAVDLKMNRKTGTLQQQQWTWFADDRAGLKAAVDDALGRFETFQAQDLKAQEPKEPRTEDPEIQAPSVSVAAR